MFKAEAVGDVHQGVGDENPQRCKGAESHEQGAGEKKAHHQLHGALFAYGATGQGTEFFPGVEPVLFNVVVVVEDVDGACNKAEGDEGQRGI